jgi:hypothetical protein
MSRLLPIVHLTMGRPSPLEGEGCVETRDVYDLARLDLTDVQGILVGMGVDELYLGRHGHLLDDFVVGGGVFVACAHFARPYLTGMCAFVPIDHHRPSDLEVHRLAPHPVWEGVRGEDLTFRRGVAGFYGRGGYRALPDGATVVNTIGRERLPLDFHYPLGSGEILVHGGNDLWGYRGDENTSARMTPQLLRWVLDRRRSS